LPGCVAPPLVFARSANNDIGNTDKIAISNVSCQQLTAKNRGVRIVEVGHVEEGVKKKDKITES
jgi:hypothetical protein